MESRNTVINIVTRDILDISDETTYEFVLRDIFASYSYWRPCTLNIESQSEFLDSRPSGFELNLMEGGDYYQTAKELLRDSIVHKAGNGVITEAGVSASTCDLTLYRGLYDRVLRTNQSSYTDQVYQSRICYWRDLRLLTKELLDVMDDSTLACVYNNSSFNKQYSSYLVKYRINIQNGIFEQCVANDQITISCKTSTDEISLHEANEIKIPLDTGLNQIIFAYNFRFIGNVLSMTIAGVLENFSLGFRITRQLIKCTNGSYINSNVYSHTSVRFLLALIKDFKDGKLIMDGGVTMTPDNLATRWHLLHFIALFVQSGKGNPDMTSKHRDSYIEYQNRKFRFIDADRNVPIYQRINQDGTPNEYSSNIDEYLSQLKSVDVYNKLNRNFNGNLLIWQLAGYQRNKSDNMVVAEINASNKRAVVHGRTKYLGLQRLVTDEVLAEHKSRVDCMQSEQTKRWSILHAAILLQHKRMTEQEAYNMIQGFWKNSIDIQEVGILEQLKAMLRNLDGPIINKQVTSNVLPEPAAENVNVVVQSIKSDNIQTLIQIYEKLNTLYDCIPDTAPIKQIEDIMTEMKNIKTDANKIKIDADADSNKRVIDIRNKLSKIKKRCDLIIKNRTKENQAILAAERDRLMEKYKGPNPNSIGF